MVDQARALWDLTWLMLQAFWAGFELFFVAWVFSFIALAVLFATDQGVR
jgi:hypothetical protein